MSNYQPSADIKPANFGFACNDDKNDNSKLDYDRELIVFRSQLCEQAGRFEDMVLAMNELCQKYDDLTHDEKNLLSCAYKNVIGSRRTSWRVLSGYLQTKKDSKCLEGGNREKQQKYSNTNDNINNTNNINNNNNNNNDNSQQLNSSNNYKNESHYSATVVGPMMKNIEVELRKHCCNIIDILSHRLIPSNTISGESRVFYHKMKGDYLRYLCEISSIEERKEKSNESLMAYKTASDKAMIELPPTHPVRLGLMLNFSVFFYDIMKSPERSCRLAKQAFDDAIAELDTLSEESYRDSTIIMQLLRDNLNLWESEQSLHQHQQQQQQQQINNLQTNNITSTNTVE